jgi:hypothetical protein
MIVRSSIALSLVCCFSLAQAQGSLSFSNSWDVEGVPSGSALIDVDNDGDLDLLVSTHEESFGYPSSGLPGQLVTYINDGLGNLSLQNTLPVFGTPKAITVADFNADSLMDVAIAHHTFPGEVSVLLNTGTTLAQAPGSPYIVGAGPEVVKLGDVNNDGFIDLVTLSRSDNTFSVLLGTGEGNFHEASGSPFPTLPNPTGFAVGDINNDGFDDVAAMVCDNAGDSDLCTSMNNPVSLFFSNGDGSFGQEQTLYSIGAGARSASTITRGMVIGDMNDDGNNDIVIAAGEYLTVMQGTGSGTFGFGPGSPYFIDLASIAVRDIDNNGTLDVIGAFHSLESEDAVVILPGLGDGRLDTASVQSFATGETPANFAFGDIDGDLAIDAIVPNVESLSISLITTDRIFSSRF